MPEYTFIINDSSSYPDYRWDEVIVSAEVYDVSIGLPPVNNDTMYFVAGYNRMLVKTRYLDLGLGNRKPPSHYYSSDYSAPKNYLIPEYNRPGFVVPSKESPVDRSLTSKSMTGGNISKKLVMIKPQYGKYASACPPGYRFQYVNGNPMCVKK